MTASKALRHKWEKHYCTGRFSSFETSATCKVCGLRRERLGMGRGGAMRVMYILPGGDHQFYKAPPCVAVV